MQHVISMLHESEGLQIYKCKCCNHYNLNYRNLFLSFSSREFRSFLKVLKQLEPHHFTCIHPEGNKAVISQTKFSGGIGFTVEEAEWLITQIEQALIIEEANKALANSKH